VRKLSTLFRWGSTWWCGPNGTSSIFAHGSSFFFFFVALFVSNSASSSFVFLSDQRLLQIFLHDLLFFVCAVREADGANMPSHNPVRFGPDVLTKRQGRALGLCLFATSVVSALCFGQRPREWSVGVASLVTGGLGYYLYERLYLHDPEARAEYVALINGQPFGKSVRDMGVTVILQLVSVEDARVLLTKEFPSMHFSGVFGSLGRTGIEDCFREGLISHCELENAFLRDVEEARRRSREPFSSLWDAVGRVGLTFALSLSIVPSGELHKLLLQEYPAAREEAIGAYATAPPSDEVVRHRPETFARVLDYGTFCVQELDIDRSCFVRILQTCRQASELSYTALLGKGLLRLFQEGFVESAWCVAKLEQQIHQDKHRVPTLDEMDAHESISKQISSGMIPAHVLAPIFTAAIPVSPFASTATNDNNIVLFLEKHKHLLEVHGSQLVDRSMWPHMLWVKCEWEKASVSADERFPVPTKKKKKTSSDVDDAVKATQVASEKSEFLKTKRKQLHAEFCAHVAHAAANPATAYVPSEANRVDVNVCMMM
jgi:hypothetical protein